MSLCHILALLPKHMLHSCLRCAIAYMLIDCILCLMAVCYIIVVSALLHIVLSQFVVQCLDQVNMAKSDAEYCAGYCGKLCWILW